jgi:hypothetical protein
VNYVKVKLQYGFITFNFRIRIVHNSLKLLTRSDICHAGCGLQADRFLHATVEAVGGTLRSSEYRVGLSGNVNSSYAYCHNAWPVIIGHLVNVFACP